MVDCSRLDRFLHMPIQSGSDTVLRAMKRGYTVDQYRTIVNRIKERIPDMEVGCDWIVGFPGETEADHQASLDVCGEMRFSQSFVFKYSPRPGTVAAEELEDTVPEIVKKARNKDLLAAQEAVSLARNDERLGTETEILIEGISRLDDTRLSGRDPAHRIVVIKDRGQKPGELVKVRIVSATALTLFGEPIEPGTPSIHTGL